ncbi:diguanylate cyclase [Natronospirillum operosum]|uniref:Diguanylate cyclase n=1 Tax=Natronospirillum operosum TaxID=2759953 RepID=A0A4Z0WIW2_9GAMM|nr:diguanylate cyclase [Natronospirillum operosum]TGG95085.1 diguanylate cyclase [Natronospirillum operosum]
MGVDCGLQQVGWQSAHVLVVLLLAALANAVVAEEPRQQGRWIAATAPDSLAEGAAPGAGSAPSLTGGEYWHELTVQVPESGDWVLDFQNTAVIARFEHFVLAADGTEVGHFRGGLTDPEPDTFLLRHGRRIELPVGEYRILTRLESPFYLAVPVPALYMTESYRVQIRAPIVFTLMGMGIFGALAFYYLCMGLLRRSVSDLLYVGFILGNLLFFGTVLMAYRAVALTPPIYMAGVPILISNLCYVLFVMWLLGISRQRHPRVHALGSGICTVLVLFWPLALLAPNWSLELSRYGVGLMAVYGMVAGITRARLGDRVGWLYLVANLSFLVPAMLAISARELNVGSLFLIEHLGLLAVLLEVMLLSLVISYQVGRMQRREARNKVLEEQSVLLQSLTSQVPGAVYQFQLWPDGRVSIPFASAGMETLFGYPVEKICEQPELAFNRIHKEDIDAVWQSIWTSASQLAIWEQDFRLYRQGAEAVWVHGRATPQLQPDQSVLWHGFINDVTQRRAAEEQVRHLAEHDPLTGCLNRASLQRQLSRALRAAPADCSPLALLFIDLDGFKPLNDTHGHGLGDELLQGVAATIKGVLRHSDVVARLGGDEFLVLLYPVLDAENAVAVAEKIRARIEQLTIAAERELSLSASIGVALYPQHGSDQHSLIDAADAAMYRAKAAGRNRVLLAATD